MPMSLRTSSPPGGLGAFAPQAAGGFNSSLFSAVCENSAEFFAQSLSRA
jgi:hypothetical protein